jgi:hypothetical protein
VDCGSNGLVQVLTFRGATGWQIESLVGSLVHLTDSTTLRMESGAWRIGTINSTASIAMFLAAAPICVWSSWRGARLDRVAAGWLASVSALLLLSALLSAQYVIWLCRRRNRVGARRETPRRPHRHRDRADAAAVELLRRGARRRAPRTAADRAAERRARRIAVTAIARLASSTV